MDYDDFPILSDNQYSLINEKFHEQFDFDRNESVFFIFSLFCECKNACPMLEAKSNKEIREATQKSQVILERLISNFQATFNLPSKNEIKEINVFKMLKNLSKTLNLLISWQFSEKKEYFKKFALNTIEDVTAIFELLTDAIEKSKIEMFRFM